MIRTIVIFFSGSVLPHGVRIFPVYVKKKTYKELSAMTNRSPYAFMKSNDMKGINFQMQYTTGLDNAEKNEDLIIKCSSALADRRIIGETYQNRHFLESKSLKGRKMSDSSSICHDTDSEFVSQDSEQKIHSILPVTINDVLPFGTSNTCQVNECQDTPTIKRRQSDSSELSSIKDNSHESDVDAVWEVQFGGQLKDLRASVERFNKFYETPEKLRNSTNKHTTAVHIADKSMQPSDLSCTSFIAISDSDDIAVTAYKRTCEYIYSCSENASISGTDDGVALSSNISINELVSPLQSNVLIPDANSSLKPDIILSTKADHHTQNGSKHSHANNFSLQRNDLKYQHDESKCKESSSSMHPRLHETSRDITNVSQCEGDLTNMEFEKSVHNCDQSEVSQFSSDFDRISFTTEGQQSIQKAIKGSHLCGPNESDNAADKLVRDTLMSVGNALRLGSDTSMNPHRHPADTLSQDTESLDTRVKHSNQISDNRYITDEESTESFIDTDTCRQSRFSEGSLSARIAKALSGEDDTERQEDAGYYSMDKDLDGRRGNERKDDTFARIDVNGKQECRSSDEVRIDVYSYGRAKNCISHTKRLYF